MKSLPGPKFTKQERDLASPAVLARQPRLHAAGLHHGAPFADVPCGYWAAPWIAELARRGIASGCDDGNFCPETNVTRGSMAGLIVRTFGMPVKIDPRRVFSSARPEGEPRSSGPQHSHEQINEMNSQAYSLGGLRKNLWVETPSMRRDRNPV